MDVNSIKEHEFKKVIKKLIDDSPNYTEKMKFDLHAIVDTSKTIEELCQAVLSYFSALKWM